jgi:hypothetical protein
MARLAGFVLPLLLAALSASAQDHSVAKTDASVPADALAPEIAATLAPTGFKVTKGSQAIIEFWPAKEWPVEANATTGGEVLYPLMPGQLVGVARYSRKGADFRDQEIPAGVYVVRYAQQPVDGAHVGTSPTRDFFTLLPAAKDRQPAALDYKTLIGVAKQTTGTEHPAILSLQRVQDSGESPSIRHDGDHDWTIVRFTGQIKLGGMTKELPVELVVVGKAAE